ncbi:EamA family transporter [Allonocardiopsis opalescens]|uniref:Putative membrane protein n=1 Tax=Allonocardiopsis opalescens TaxID=1144618 RepID=A0A2T0Q784_9ACTN|nr:EamA family transporter [Allonocardiopsis opalescens]PRX99678.1 putative membrane protein [Allonocardiopsis opalescens]
MTAGVGPALVSAVCFGLTDVFAGLLSRRAHSAAVALLGQVAGTAAVLALAVGAPSAGAEPSALGWGALSGVGTGLGAALLFRAMGRGRFSVVVPLTVVAGVALPVLAGVLLLHDRPGVWAWAGIAASLPAVWLMSGSGRTADGTADGLAPTAGVRTALLAGVAFALQYTALAQAGPAAGLWPLAANRIVSVLTILPLVLARPSRLRMPFAVAAGSAGTGLVSAAAIASYALAAGAGELPVVVVLTSMYPAIPVLLGLTALRERLSGAQLAGLGGAAAAVVLISVG